MTTFIKRQPHLPNILVHPSASKPKEKLPWHPIKSLFQVNKYKKQILIFGTEFLTKTPQNKDNIIGPSLWHKAILHLINIYNLTQIPIQNLLVQFKSMLQQLYSQYEFGLKGSLFPLKIGTNKLNIHSSGNLSLNKILNMLSKISNTYPHQSLIIL